MVKVSESSMLGRDRRMSRVASMRAAKGCDGAEGWVYGA